MVVWVTNNSFMLLGNRSFHASVKGCTRMSQLISYDIDYFLDEVFSENKSFDFLFLSRSTNSSFLKFCRQIHNITTFISFQIPKDPKYLSSASKVTQAPDQVSLGAFSEACACLYHSYPRPNNLDEVFSVLHIFLQFISAAQSLEYSIYKPSVLFGRWKRRTKVQIRPSVC